MTKQTGITLFEDTKVRIVWDDVQEKYYFSVADIVQILTDTVNPRDYIKKMLRRDPELKSKWGTICPPHQFLSTDGKKHSVKCMDLPSILRLVQSITTKKAEPFKRWLAQVGATYEDLILIDVI